MLVCSKVESNFGPCILGAKLPPTLASREFNHWRFFGYGFAVEQGEIGLSMLKSENYPLLI